jgi:hypothetical protein
MPDFLPEKRKERAGERAPALSFHRDVEMQVRIRAVEFAQIKAFPTIEDD